MSLTKSATRRLSLMAGSSLIAASLSAFVAAGVALAPTTAQAQTATCVAPTSPVIVGNGGSAVTLPAGTYNPGILCTYTGDTASVTTSGAITVSTTGGVPADPLVNGVNLRAAGTDDITWDSTAGTVAGSSQTNGPVIDARTASGNITLTTGGVTASSATITHGIFALSSNGGDVDVTTTGSMFATNNTSGNAGIEARSQGGNGDVTVTVAAGTTNSTAKTVEGRLYGIRAEATGAGDLTIDLQNLARIRAGSSNNFNQTSAAIYAKTGTGLLRIDSVDEVGRTTTASSTGNAGAVRIETGGDAILNFANLNGGGGYNLPGGGGNAIVHMTTSAGTLTTMTHTGVWGTATNDTGTNPNALLFQAEGAGDITINSNGWVAGHFDMPTYSGDFTWNINDSHAYSKGVTRFGSGDDSLVIGEPGVWTAYTENSFGNSIFGNPTTIESAIVMDFGGGDDTFVNNGNILLGPKSSNEFARDQFNEHIESETRLVDLETFENAGTIYFGGRTRVGQSVPVGSPANFIETDGVNDDVLLAPGAHWIGSGDSRLVLDAFLTENQSACDASLRDTAITSVINNNVPPTESLSGEMPAADCLGLQGGSTEGVTQVLVNQLAQGDRGGLTRIVLVDVAGGESATGHFVLDPQTVGYNPDQGGYLDLGFMIMPLVYDADAQQHVLLGAAGQNAWQTATMAAAAHDIWRTSTGTWFDRQADLRGALPDGVGGGIWLRTSADFAQRDVAQTTTAGASSFTFDNSYEQNTYAVTGGVDLLSGSGGDSAWAVGLMAGYANSELTYDASPNTTQFDSWNGGVYATFLSDGLYVDAAVSGNKADVKAAMPALNLFPADTVLDTRLLTVGAQVEAGWRFPIGGGGFVEPLAGVSYVRTNWDDLPVPSDDPVRPGVDVEFDDPTSLRANLGARLGLDQDYGGLRAQYSILGRVWEEFEGEHDLILHNTQEDILVGDAFTGTLSEFGVGVSLYGLGEALSGFASFGGKFGDDYTSQNVAVGVRVNW